VRDGIGHGMGKGRRKGGMEERGYSPPPPTLFPGAATGCHLPVPLAYEKYGLISAVYGFSKSHIISRKLSTVGSAEHYYRKLASLILLLHSEFTSSLRREPMERYSGLISL